MQHQVLKLCMILAGAAFAGVSSVYLIDHLSSDDFEKRKPAVDQIPTPVMASPDRVERLIRPQAGQAVAFSLPEKKQGLSLSNLVEQTADELNEALMDEVIAALVSEIEDARHKGNVKRILELAKKLRSLGYGSKSARYGHGMAAVGLKRALLSALAATGPAGIGEVVRLLGDSEPIVAQSATDILFKTLQDISLGDRDRAEIVVAAAEEMTEEYNVMRLYQEFIRMRHSVGAEALMEISKSGSDVAKSLLAQCISAFTGDISVTEASQLESWLAEHPDSSQDEWFYRALNPGSKCE